MIAIDLPGDKRLEIENILLDFNGTLARGGEITEETILRLRRLSESVRLYVTTADTRGNASELCGELPVKILSLPGNAAEDQAKLKLLDELGRDKTAAIGNGRNDKMILAEAAIGICVFSGEGAHAAAIASSTILIDTIENALRLFEEPVRLVATLRN